MALIHSKSPEATLSNLDLFTVPPTQTAITNKQYVNFYPISELSEDAPIEFSVSRSSREYISLRDTLLYIKAKIVKGDG